jgi:hypothetical protein
MIQVKIDTISKLNCSSQNPSPSTHGFIRSLYITCKSCTKDSMCVLYRLQFGTGNDWYHLSHNMHTHPSAILALQKTHQTGRKERKKSFSKHLEMGRVERHNHEQTRNETSTRQGDDPTGEDEADLLPVDSLEVKVAEGNTNRGTSQTLGSGDGESETRSEENGDGGAELHAETTRRRDLGDFVAKSADNVVAVEPETETEEETGDDEDPDGRVGFLGDDTRGVGVVGTDPGADSVGNVVGSVGNGHHHGRGNLGVRPEMLDAVVVDDGAGVDVDEI